MVPNIKGKHILITGSQGYIAKAILEQIDLSSNKITLLSHKPTNNPHSINGNLCDPQFWSQHIKHIDIVFHLAGMTSLKQCEQNPIDSLKANVMPTIAMIQSCMKMNVKPLVVYAGAASQVGIYPNLPVNEDTPSCPSTIYDQHKCFSEQAIHLATKNNYIKGVTLRLANVYGPGYHTNHIDRGILNQLIKKCLNNEDITIFGDGQYIRDYVHICDVANAFLHAAYYLEKINKPFLYVGSGQGRTIKETFHILAEQVHQIAGISNLIKYVPWPQNTLEAEKRNFIADISNIKYSAQWSPSIDFTFGLQQTIEFFIEKDNHEKSKKKKY